MKNMTITGNLTNDVILKTVNTARGEQQVASFSVAANSSRGTNKQVEYINCSAWGNLGVAANTYLHKGSKVYVAGDFRSSVYKGKDGFAHCSLEMRVETLEFLDPAPKQGSGKGIDAEPAPEKGKEPVAAEPVTTEDLPF